MYKVYIDEGGIKQLYHDQSTCMGDNPLAKARGLSPRAGKQTIYYYMFLHPIYSL